MEDYEIIQLYLDRNEYAIRLTADKYGPRLRAISYKITGDSGTAEGCENDTYLETWNRIPPNEPRNYFFAFLARITRAISIDRCRERSRLKRDGRLVELTEELETCIPSVNSVEKEVESKLLGEVISRFLNSLPIEKRVMFMRRYFYLDNVSEIAKRLSISKSKVKTSLFRIRNDLKDYL